MDFLSEIFLETQYEHYKFNKTDLKEAARLLDKNTDWSWEGIKKIYTSIMRSVFENKDAEYLYNYYSNEFKAYKEEEKRIGMPQTSDANIPDKKTILQYMKSERIFPDMDDLTDLAHRKKCSSLSGKEYLAFSQDARYELDLVLQGFGEDYIIAAMLEILYDNEPRTFFKEFTALPINDEDEENLEFVQWKEKYEKWKKRMEEECHDFPDTWELPEIVEEKNLKDCQSSFLVMEDIDNSEKMKFLGKSCDIELFKIIYKRSFWGLFDNGKKERKNLERVDIDVLKRMFKLDKENEIEVELEDDILLNY